MSNPENINPPISNLPYTRYEMPKAGSLKNLKPVQGTLPPPGTNEIQVSVKAIGLNFADIFVVHGLYSATPKGPFTPGLEYSGVVTAIGSGTTRWQVGDKVMGATRFGGYTTALNTHERYATPLPEGWSMAEGAGFLVQGLTAYYALVYLGELPKVKTVLIHSAAGGVGILANRIARAHDVYTIGTVGSTAKVDFLLKEEGYDKVIVRGRDFRERLQEALDGRPLELVLECIGGRIFKESYKAMAPMSRLITFGSASFASHGSSPNWPVLLWKYLTRPKIDLMKMPQKNKAVLGFNLIWLYDRIDLLEEVLQGLMALNLPPQHIGNRFPFDQLPDAIRLFQKGQTIGKVVVEVE